MKGMMHQDLRREAMEAFIKQLPSPQVSKNSTIQSDVTVGGEDIQFVAQKVKGTTGIIWKVYPIDLRGANRLY